MEKGIGKQTIKGLRIIEKEHLSSVRQFGRLMWPDSPHWNEVYKSGRGSVWGRGMCLAAGSFLAKLWHADLIDMGAMIFEYKPMVLTDKGKRVLAEVQQD